MNGEIYRHLVLATYGNAMLCSRQPSGNFSEHIAFKFSEFVKFVHLDMTGKTQTEQTYAADPNDWLQKLRNDGCIGLRVSQQPINDPNISDRHSAAFAGGGGQWMIETVFGGHSDFWASRNAIGDEDHPDEKIWHVTYGRVLQHRGPKQAAAARTTSKSIRALTKDLDGVLGDAQKFAQGHDLGEFATSFQKARATLASHAEPDLQGIAPLAFLTIEAARLLAAAQASYVFGGMGSWNDIGFDQNEQQSQDGYERISDDLFDVVNQSLVAAANASFPTPEKKSWQFWK